MTDAKSETPAAKKTLREACQEAGTTPRAFFATLFTTCGVIVFIVWAVFFTGPTSEEKAKKDAHARKYGHQCLNPWDGAHDEAVRELKKKLRDPDSFQISKTITSLINENNGQHRLIIVYRATNGFGGLNLETAVGFFRASDCKFVGFV